MSRTFVLFVIFFFDSIVVEFYPNFGLANQLKLDGYRMAWLCGFVVEYLKCWF